MFICTKTLKALGFMGSKLSLTRLLTNHIHGCIKKELKKEKL
jgi:hypothetical protein